MSTTIPRTVNQDWRVIASQDEANQRKIRIKNIQREIVENQPKWNAKQKELYGNLLQVSPEITEEAIITMEKQVSDDDGNNEAIAFQKLVSISSPEIAQYMIDRLAPDEIKWLIVNFNNLVRKFRKDKVKLDKDILLNQIRAWSAESPVSNAKLPLTERAVARQGVQREKGLQLEEQKVEENNKNAEEEIDDDLEEQRAVRQARQRKDDEQNASLLNANYGAPTQAGTNSSIGNTTINSISPTKEYSAETLYDVYGASPPVQGSNN